MLKTRQLSVTLPHKRGQLAALTCVLAKAKVNIIAISVLDSTEQGTVRLVVDKPDAAVKALAQAKMPFTQIDVLVAPLPNKVGALADVMAKLAKKGVNVNFIYGSAARGRGASHIVVACNKMPTAEKVLKAL